MTGIEDFEAHVGVGGGEILGKFRRHDVVVGAVEDERGLAEIRVVRILAGIFEKSVGEPAGAILAVVEDLDRAGVAPLGDGVGAHPFLPSAGKTERGSEQDDARDFGVAFRIERGQVSAHAAADQRDGLAGGGAFDHLQLGGEGEMFEIAIGQVGNIDGSAGVAQPLCEESRLAGCGRRGEAVEIEDAVHFLAARPAGFGEFGEFDLRVRAEHLEGLVTVEILGDQLAIDQVAVDDRGRREEAVRGGDVIHGSLVANDVALLRMLAPGLDAQRQAVGLAHQSLPSRARRDA